MSRWRSSPRIFTRGRRIIAAKFRARFQGRQNEFRCHRHRRQLCRPLRSAAIGAGAPAADARAQLMKYPTVAWVDAKATTSEGETNAFSVSTESGAQYGARRIILAAGVVDALPDVPGLAERWGKHVFHCPYCHG